MLITLDDLKSYLKITDTESDNILTSSIEEAGSFIESYTGRSLEATDYTLRIDGNGQNELLLPNFPVTTMTSLSYNSGTIGTPVWTPYDIDSYYCDESTGVVSLTFGLSRGIKNIKVVYTAGYETIPSDIQRATIQIATYYYSGAGKTTSQVKREQVDGASIEYDTTIGGIEQDTYSTLNKYKKYA